MKAIVQDTYGSPDVLNLSAIDTPRVGDDEALVRVHAAGLDRGVWHLLTGLPYLTPQGTLVIAGGEGGGRWFGGIDRQLRAMMLSRLAGQKLGTFIRRHRLRHGPPLRSQVRGTQPGRGSRGEMAGSVLNPRPYLKGADRPLPRLTFLPR